MVHPFLCVGNREQTSGNPAVAFLPRPPPQFLRADVIPDRQSTHCGPPSSNHNIYYSANTPPRNLFGESASIWAGISRVFGWRFQQLDLRWCMARGATSFFYYEQDVLAPSQPSSENTTRCQTRVVGRSRLHRRCRSPRCQIRQAASTGRHRNLPVSAQRSLYHSEERWSRLKSSCAWLELQRTHHLAN